MSRALSSNAYSSLTRKEKSKAKAWLELMTSLRILFELEHVGKPKGSSLAWVDLIN